MDLEVGQTILVVMRYEDETGALAAARQYAGTITALRDGAVVIEMPDGATASLPFGSGVFRPVGD